MQTRKYLDQGENLINNYFKFIRICASRGYIRLHGVIHLFKYYTVGIGDNGDLAVIFPGGIRIIWQNPGYSTNLCIQSIITPGKLYNADQNNCSWRIILLIGYMDIDVIIDFMIHISCYIHDNYVISGEIVYFDRKYKNDIEFLYTNFILKYNKFKLRRLERANTSPGLLTYNDSRD